MSRLLFILLLSFFSLQVSARNVILFIGDGMDDQQITIARNYLQGAEGLTVLDNMALRSTVQVITLDEEAPEKKVYVADSANSATSMATGVDTSMGRIATSAKDDEDLPTILELANKAGLKTGLVSTASITDATPASFVAHISNRDCESTPYMKEYRDKLVHIIDCQPDMKVNGGQGSIAEQIVYSDVDLLLGGGRSYFLENEEADEMSLYQRAVENGFEVVDTLEVASNAPENKKILGLFAEEHLAVKLQGSGGAKAEKPDVSLLASITKWVGSVKLPDVVECEANPDYKKNNTPALKDMTSLALDRLQNDKGFFLMVESASIDKQSHRRKPCGSIGEAEQLFESVQVALDFAEKFPETLVLVTADHAQAAQIVPNGSLFDGYMVPIASPGHVARIRTREGGVLVVNYATNDFLSEEHTGANVPLFANKQFKDKHGKDLIKSFHQQKEIFDISRRFLGL